jgi:hypothetical protein
MKLEKLVSKFALSNVFNLCHYGSGEIKDWYPDNPVLRKLTPIETCRPMEVFPVLVRPDGVYVDVKNGSLGPDFVVGLYKFNAVDPVA